MAECEYPGCSSAATHILVDKYQKIIGAGEAYCNAHAFEDGRFSCNICERFRIFVELDNDEEENVQLLPTYNQLEEDGFCSFHP